MDGSKRFNRFEFDYDPRLDQQIDSVPALKFHVFVNNRYRLLPLYLQVPQFQFLRQTLLVSGFQQARSKKAMNFNRRPNDLMRYVIVVHREKNLTQRTQREESTEFTESRIG